MKKEVFKNWSKDELISEILKLKKRKKYGIVWEEKDDEEVKKCEKNLPLLDEVKEKQVIYDKSENHHLILEGDNYHALSVLNYTHLEKIDLIYIDPPYNTGKKDEFKYNDHWVDENDSYRFSKWLSFMKKRLAITKDLLKDSGVILISIDDNMQAPLKLLCDEIYGKQNFVSNFIWRGGKRNASKHISISHEYILLYAKNLKTISEKKISWKSKKKGLEIIYKQHNFLKKKFKNNYSLISKELKKWFKKLANDNPAKDHQHYCCSDKRGIYFASDISRGGGGGGKWKVKNPFTQEYVQIPSRGWSFRSEKEMKKEIEQDNIHFNAKSVPCQKRYLKDMETAILDSVFYKDRRSASQKFRELMGGDVFQNPKDHEIISNLIKCFSPDDAIILDFFAGSGTTGHAVLDLNSSQGNRKFILSTNNENNICSNICYPRLLKVIKGYKINNKKIAPLTGNLKYFKTTLIASKESDGNKIVIAKKLTEILCIKENTFERVVDNKNYKIFKNKNKFTFIIYDQLIIDNIKKIIHKYNGNIKIYIFSLGSDLFEEDFEEFENVIVETIPEPIISISKRLYK